MKNGISIVIPTYNGGGTFKRCLDRIKQQDYPKIVQLIVIDSGSTDGTGEMARCAGAVFIQIPQKTFHHARTRNQALEWVEHDHVVYMVQDGIPCTRTWLSDLERSITVNPVDAVYIRQIPHDDADLFARFETRQNSEYLGSRPRVQQVDSIRRFNSMPYKDALRCVRLDNVCTIYRTDALRQIPFPDTPFGEDLAWAHRAMMRGLKILYQPEIVIQHSHNRPADYHFKRAVVETVCCARILNRVNFDLSFLGAGDLRDMQKTVNESMGPAQLGITDGVSVSLAATPFSKRMRLRVWTSGLPILRSRKLKRLAGTLLMHPRLKLLAREQIVNNICRRIRDNQRFVRYLYRNASPAELMQVAECFAASQLGTLYGTVYASRMLKGTVDRAIEHLMKPFFQGV